MKFIAVFIIYIFLGSLQLAAQTDSSVIGPKPGDGKINLEVPTIPGVDNGTPDLIVSSVSVGPIVNDHRNGQVTQHRVVQYVIKNIGTAKADLGKIAMQGFLGYDDVFIISNMVATCGGLAKQGTGNFIYPGATYNGSYKCSYEVDKWRGMKYYLLKADYHNAIPEQNENNNTKVANLN